MAMAGIGRKQRRRRQASNVGARPSNEKRTTRGGVGRLRVLAPILIQIGGTMSERGGSEWGTWARVRLGCEGIREAGWASQVGLVA